MRQAAFLLALALFASPAAASCDRSPAASSFGIRDQCSYDKPCLEEQANRLTLIVDTACYPWWKPCAPFAFDACDIVEWDFGDGTKKTVQGSAAVTHEWEGPGYYFVDAAVRNAHGTRYVSSAITIVRKPPARVDWSSALYTATEDDGEITLTLERDGDLSRAVTVLLRAGTKAGEGEPWDRNLEHVVDRPVTIPAGATTFPVTLKLRDDAQFLGEQRYDVFVHDNTGQALLPTSNHLALTEVRILDDEQGPTLTVHDQTVDEGDTGSRTIRIPHVLSAPLPTELVLWWQIAPGTATHAADWETVTGGPYYVSKSIPAGQLRYDLEIVVHGDTQAEADETVVIALAEPYGAAVTYSQPRVTITIRDDDAYALTPHRARADAGEKVPLTLKTARPSAATTVVPLSSSDPTIVSVPAFATLPAGAAEASFDVQALRAGKATVSATFPDGKTVSSTITVEATPQIDLITPASGSTSGGTEVTIHGSDFSADCTVSFGGAPATSDWTDAQTLTATTPPHAAGEVDVTVQCGARTATKQNGFEYKLGRRRAVRS